MSRRIRLIPARAGNIIPHSTRHHPRAAHPRSRGEHASRVLASACSRGSSPLARGTSLHALNGDVLTRLIPARAGNICRCRLYGRVVSAHPRSRGEHASMQWIVRACPGSSPLARGTWTFAHGSIPSLRLIPARAGNMPRQRHCPGLEAAHPRSRGEHRYGLVGTDTNAGSSPLARGTSAGLRDAHF